MMEVVGPCSVWKGKFLVNLKNWGGGWKARGIV